MEPRARPQSTVARNFMSELDDLFKIEGGLDSLDRNVHQKKQEVFTHTQQLEALEARLKETEERLKHAKTSPPAHKDGHRRAPVQGAFPDNNRIGDGSPRAARKKPEPGVLAAKEMPDRPHTARTDDGTKA